MIGQQQALVNHGPARHAGNVVFLAVLELERLDAGAGRLADDIELALEGILHNDVVAATDENLADDGLLLAHGRRHWHFVIHRHIAPAQQDLAFGLDGAFHLLLTSQARSVLLGQEDHAHTVFAQRRQGHALRRHLRTVQCIGQLNQDACAVTHQFVGANGTPVVQVLQNLERVLDDLVRLGAFDMRHKPDTAGVMFLGRRIQTVFLEIRDLGSRRHGALLNIQN